MRTRLQNSRWLLAGAAIFVVAILAGFWFSPEASGAPSPQPTTCSTCGQGSGIGQPAGPNLLVNGDLERGFVYRPECGGHVGRGWGCFTNAGQTAYGFYDDQWPPVVDLGAHSQLIELNTINLGVADPDRYAGLYQTVQVEPGTAYVFFMRGMIRTTDNNSGDRDPFRFRVQFGWSFGDVPDWQNVQRWVDVGWNTYYDRLRPGQFSTFTTKVLAQEETMTIFVRVWKKWGDVGEELDVNFDNFALSPTVPDALVLPTLEPTPLPTGAPTPLRLSGGTPVAELPTPPSVYGQRFVPVPGGPPGTANWPRINGAAVSFAHPRTWKPMLNNLAGNAVIEEYRLGIPNQPNEQILGFSSVPFGNIVPPEPGALASQITIGGQPGVKWIRQGPNYIIYEYCTSGYNGEGSFCVRVLLPTSNPMIELQLDRLVQTIVFY
jgi:hypothetical protein